jgi:hypothetical protein
VEPGAIKALEVAAAGNADGSGMSLTSEDKKALPASGGVGATKEASVQGGGNGMVVVAAVVLLVAILLGAILSR